MKIKITKKQEITNDVLQEPCYIVGEIDEESGVYVSTFGRLLNGDELSELSKQLENYCLIEAMKENLNKTKL